MKIGMPHQPAAHLVEAKGHRHWHRLPAAAAVQTKLVDGFRQPGHAQGRRVASQQAKAMPARHLDRLLPACQQQRIERLESRRLELLASLGKGALGNGADKGGLVAQASEEVVQFALEALDETLGKTSHQHGERQRATAGEIGWIGAMGCDELIGFEQYRRFGE